MITVKINLKKKNFFFLLNKHNFYFFLLKYNRFIKYARIIQQQRFIPLHECTKQLSPNL